MKIEKIEIQLLDSCNTRTPATSLAYTYISLPDKNEITSSEKADKGRREFMKTAGAAAGGLIIGAVGIYAARQTEVGSLNSQISSLQTQVQGLTPKVLDNIVGLKNAGERYTAWVAFSTANTVDSVDHRVAMQGVVRFNPDKQVVEGGGSFVHFDNAPPVPKPVIASGKWETTGFVSYTPKSPPAIYGPIEAGILVMNANLLPSVGPNAGKVLAASLRAVCNIGALGPAGNMGEPEGYVLTIPGSPFAADGAAGPFKPIVPPIGLTHISVVGTA